MKTITTEQLNEILENHKKWLNDEGGEKADLSYTNLKDADLSGADLREADLSGADLRGADLSLANLKSACLIRTDLRLSHLNGANLSCSDLPHSDLTEVNLRGINLKYANLRGTNLRRTDLSMANLTGANLTGANLTDSYLTNTILTIANLTGVDLNNINYDETTCFLSLQCPEEGSFIGYKKSHNKIVKLLITEDSLRSSATTRKCRCSKARVLSITNIENTEEFEIVESDYDKNFIYKVGEIVEVKDFDEDRWNECSTGIHFFITRQEAVNY